MREELLCRELGKSDDILTACQGMHRISHDGEKKVPCRAR